MTQHDEDKMFELMEKLDPNFKRKEKQKMIMEVGGQPVQNNMNTDVARLQKVTQQNSAMQNARERIDTPQDFKQAFQVWMATTGFVTDNKPFNITQAQQLVREAMEELGFK